MDAQIEAMMKQHANIVTASLAGAESMVFKARMERSAIEFDLRAAYSRIENLQARTAGLKEQHAKAIDAVNVALERQEALRTVLQPIAPWMFAVPAGDGPRPVEKLTAAQFDQYGEVLGDIEAGAEVPAQPPARPIGVGQFLRAKA
jgi:Na+-translocating ferredoxin:NAD+ oxidoreductase RnfC subunit